MIGSRIVREDEPRQDGHETFLMLAARYQFDPQVIHCLIKAGASVFDQDKNQWTALDYAAAYNPNPDCCNELLAAGADPDYATPEGKTPLDLAIVRNNTKVAKTILVYLSKKSDLVGPITILDALSTCTKTKVPIDRVKILLNAWDDLATDQSDFKDLVINVFQQAVVEGELDIVKLYIAKHFAFGEYFSPKDTLAKLSANIGTCKNPAVLDSLVQCGASVNVSDKLGLTPLMWAAYDNNNSLLVKLLSLGAEVSLRNNGNSALIIAARQGNLEGLKILVKAGGNVNSRDKDGKTLLMLACRDPQIFKLLLNLGANPRLTAPNGLTLREYILTSNEEYDESLEKGTQEQCLNLLNQALKNNKTGVTH